MRQALQRAIKGIYCEDRKQIDSLWRGMPVTRVYFVRHAEAEGNLYRICEGQYNGLLTAYGRAQLPYVTSYFKGIQLDAVYTSDLHRAYETAKAVAAASGLPVIPRRDLREIDFGAYEGVPWGDINRQWPEAQDRFYHDLRQFQAPGGESAHDVVQRLTKAVREIAARHPNGTVAIVGHSAAFGAFFPAVTYGFDSLRELQYMHNAAVTLMETDGTVFTTLQADVTSHLSALEQDGIRYARRPKLQFAYRFADLRRDEAFLRACGEGAWRAVYGNLHLFSGDRFFANVRGIIQAGRNNAFIPLADGKPAGLLLLDSRQQDEPATGHVALVYLLPEYRGVGLGAQLIGRAVIEYRARGMKTLRLNVATVNKTAQRFYERLDFFREPSLHQVLSRQIVMKFDLRLPQAPESPQEEPSCN